MYTIIDRLKTVSQIDMEITTVCNHKCRYCYNFWRHDQVSNNIIMSKQTIDTIIDDIIKNKVFNVVLTGGEPFTNFDVLLHGVKRLTEAGILVSCNSNMTFATKEKLQMLKDAGLPHILTSLASFDPEVNDRIFNKSGAFAKVVKSIIDAVNVGIKISINTVISRYNKENNVYKTGMLAHALGASNIFLTRVVPCSAATNDVAQEFVLEAEEYIPVLDAAIKLKEEVGINIGSLIQYPVCFLKDVEKYTDFVGRGCTAGKKMVCINANGETHACFHEEKSYGNVLELGLEGVWKNMEMWRDGSLVPDDCKNCKWLRWCEAGCRIFADTLNSPDYMCRGSDELPDPIEDYEKSMHLVNDGKFRVRKGLRYREEEGFWLVHIVGAWIAKVTDEAVKFLIEYEKSNKIFANTEFPGSKEELADLLTKNIVKSFSV